MTYTKPQVGVLGNASTVIQGAKNLRPIEPAQKRTPVAAYDLDE